MLDIYAGADTGTNTTFGPLGENGPAGLRTLYPYRAGIEYDVWRLTFGASWKPSSHAPVTGLMIRPEIRWDHAFTGNHPFNAQQDNDAVTLVVDGVVTF